MGLFTLQLKCNTNNANGDDITSVMIRQYYYKITTLTYIWSFPKALHIPIFLKQERKNDTSWLKGQCNVNNNAF